MGSMAGMREQGLETWASIQPNLYASTIELAIVEHVGRPASIILSREESSGYSAGPTVRELKHIGSYHFSILADHILQVRPASSPREVGDEDLSTLIAGSETARMVAGDLYRGPDMHPPWSRACGSNRRQLIQQRQRARGESVLTGMSKTNSGRCHLRPTRPSNSAHP